MSCWYSPEAILRFTSVNTSSEYGALSGRFLALLIALNPYCAYGPLDGVPYLWKCSLHVRGQSRSCCRPKVTGVAPAPPPTRQRRGFCFLEQSKDRLRRSSPCASAPSARFPRLEQGYSQIASALVLFAFQKRLISAGHNRSCKLFHCRMDNCRSENCNYSAC